MRYRINCIIIGLLIIVAFVIIVINIIEIRELKRSVNARLNRTTTTDLHVIPSYVQARNAWIYPENVRYLVYVILEYYHL